LRTRPDEACKHHHRIYSHQAEVQGSLDSRRENKRARRKSS
jgi:hypothetical protein